ncbi:hydroxymethylglutaryl-CoA lyase [Priestia megaterium]|nr:hydroxymethylglutaryl-CoA lyase [Priestia megaterium]
MTFPTHVTIIEVGPRDGLQNEKKFVPTDVKIEFIRLLKEAGISEIELTSFVSPTWVPQMKDASEIVNAFSPHASREMVLVPNQKGLDKVFNTTCQAVALFIGVSDSFNQKNINKTTKESIEVLLPLVKQLKEKDMFIRTCISTSFYCPYEGKIDENKTIDLCSHFVEAGVHELSIADTIGMANPRDVFSLFSKLKKAFPHVLLNAHFHDTRGMAMANIYAALQAGINRFDSSAGGLGGCPFAKGATGNVATEDIVFMFHEMGIQTNIDEQKLLKAVSYIAPHISRPIDSKQFLLLQSNKNIVAK